MSKKILDTTSITSELRQGSVFFQQDGSKSVRPEREERPVQEERAVTEVRSVRLERNAHPPTKRERKRHPFDIYRDQYETLLKLKSAYMMETGEMKSMSEMVREALDNYLEADQKRTSRTHRTESTTSTQPTERTEMRPS